MQQLRRDLSSQIRIQIADEISELGVRTPEDLQQLTPFQLKVLRAKWSRDNRFLKDCWTQRSLYEKHLGQLRAKGCGFKNKVKGETKGSRISKVPKDRACKKIPLQGIYWKTRLWLRKQSMAYAYPRPAQMLSQFKIFLMQELGIQSALQDIGHPAHQPWVFKACEQKLKMLTSDKLRQIYNYQSGSLLPAIGARRRKGQKMNNEQGSGQYAEIHAKVQWQVTDYAFHLNQCCDPALLKPYIKDPAHWIENRASTWLVESDATAIWLRLSGQEGVILPDFQLETNRRHRTLSRWLKEASSDEERMVIQDFLAQAAKQEVMPEQVHFQGQSGGDKYRLTLLVSIGRSGWFQGGQTPQGHLLPFILLVPCSQHTRLEDLDSSGRYNKEVQYRGPDDSLIIRKPGQYAQGRLGTWVQFRRDCPDHPFWKMGKVWGQPRAWQDQIISCWHLEQLSRRCRPQIIHMVDCLEASWSEPVLHTAYQRFRL